MKTEPRHLQAICDALTRASAHVTDAAELVGCSASLGELEPALGHELELEIRSYYHQILAYGFGIASLARRVAECDRTTQALSTPAPVTSPNGGFELCEVCRRGLTSEEKAWGRCEGCATVTKVSIESDGLSLPIFEKAAAVCGAKRPGDEPNFICSRSKWHQGAHIAHDAQEGVIASWPDQDRCGAYVGESNILGPQFCTRPVGHGGSHSVGADPRDLPETEEVRP